MTTPFSPREALKAAESAFPAQVFEAFNELLAENLSRRGGRVSASFPESAVVERIVSKGVAKAELYQRGWLDIQHHYQQLGWSVDRDVPGFNESYPATFNFKASLSD